MRPLTLKLTAFGPYKNTEIIDFRELGDNRLYVISGNTGAGKTTIFDGICFALFGSASGSDRGESRLMRSDFADDEVHTSAELLFELGGRTYRILRQPGHVKLGNKTKTGERYEFFEIRDEKEIPAVDRQIVSEIDKKVEDIIGLTEKQFKQIVMLPQGEFRKLLTSDAENKQSILRQLFKTSKYNHLNEIIKEKRQRTDKAFDQVKRDQEHFIHSISTSLPQREDSTLTAALAAEYKHMEHISAGIGQEIEYYKDRIETEKLEYEKVYTEHEMKQQLFYEAEQVNKLFDEMASKQNEVTELEARSTQYKELEERLVQAGKAAEIEWQEQQRNQLQQDLDYKRTFANQVHDRFLKAQEGLEVAEKRLTDEIAKEDERQQCQKELINLQNLLPIFEQLNAAAHERDLAHKKQEATSLNLQKEREALISKNEQLLQADKYIKELEQAVDQLPEKIAMRNDLREICKLLSDYLTLQQKYEESLKLVQREEIEYKEFYKSYKKVENEWLNGQASLLAEHLHEGESCPVCGSIEHPQKAVSTETAISRDVLNREKLLLEQKENAFRSAEATLNNTNSEKKRLGVLLEQRGIDCTKARDTYNETVTEGKQLSLEITKLEKQRTKLLEERKKHEHTVLESRKHTEQCAHLESEFYKFKSVYESSLRVYEDKLTRIPENLRDHGKLEQELSKVEQKYSHMKQTYEKAMQDSEKAKSELAGQVVEKRNALANKEEAEKRFKQAELQFAVSLEQKGFDSEESYKKAKMNSVDREQGQARLESFNQHLHSLQMRISELSGKLKGKQRTPLDMMREEIQELKNAYEGALQHLNHSKQYLQTAILLQQQLADTGDAIDKIERERAIITDLYETLRGQNPRKISFERYLQIEYLEQIIEAANERLHELSNGQFRLVHSNRQEARGKASGLGLDVYDSYTGQTRDVKTLSGGEKFNASLCLALGMSDVIQSFQGNVSIETMFIDEGFGSLDEESLHKAIDALIGLQKTGRMIGVISHVHELKAMFPATLEVKKTKEGCSRTKFVIK
ncbi:SMC family ATPase [Aciduricibacillus chroicocephali]|uniref:Nuclease SbcCD subunit C n=1 Tax=Aciduricibacillus chroicocephali TaxID=3054939 RepID=A0ABY9KXI8_9BACI|nr:SMC family ATPase [Bacillaceae bacterium 44XB]